MNLKETFSQYFLNVVYFNKSSKDDEKSMFSKKDWIFNETGKKNEAFYECGSSLLKRKERK